MSCVHAFFPFAGDILPATNFVVITKIIHEFVNNQVIIHRKMYKDFLSRVTYILHNRQPHPWGASIGLDRGVVDRLKKGSVPGDKYLIAISKTENVDLNWLLYGRGAPYIVHHVATPDEAQETLSAYLDDEDWTIFCIRNYGPALAIVLCQPGSFLTDKNIEVAYTITEIFCGALSAGIFAELKIDTQSIFNVRFANEDFEALTKGYMGTFKLFGWRDIAGYLSGYIERARSIDDRKNYSASIDNAPPYVNVLCSNIMQLSPRLRESLKPIVTNLLESEGKNWDD